MITNPTPQELVKAHQFLYYQGRAVASDFAYDKFCEAHEIDGTGGSDSVGDYSEDIRKLAERIEANPHLFPP